MESISQASGTWITDMMGQIDDLPLIGVDMLTNLMDASVKILQLRDRSQAGNSCCIFPNTT